MSRTFQLSGANTADPLPSWRTGPTKTALIEFVAGASKIDGPHFVPHKKRIAVFDSDGTLWCERPIQFQIYFALDQLAELVKQNPSLGERLPFKTLLERNLKAIARLTKHEALEPVLAAYAGLTLEEFEEAAKHWFATARHPMLGRLFKDCAYLPQLELLRYLRNNGFTNYVVSDSGVDFVRALAEDVYGIPASRVIGDVLTTRLVARTAHAASSCQDEGGAPSDQRSGSRPILAFGNSDDDLPMLRHALAGNGRRLALLLHHDDKAREFAYDRDFRLCPLAKGLDRARAYGLTVVSMKRDWKRVFREPSEAFFAPERVAFVGPRSNGVGLRPAL